MIQVRADKRLLLWYGFDIDGNSVQTSYLPPSHDKPFFNRRHIMNYKPIKIKSALVKRFPVAVNDAKTEQEKSDVVDQNDSISASSVPTSVSSSEPNLKTAAASSNLELSTKIEASTMKTTASQQTQTKVSKILKKSSMPLVSPSSSSSTHVGKPAAFFSSPLTGTPFPPSSSSSDIPSAVSMPPTILSVAPLSSQPTLTVQPLCSSPAVPKTPVSLVSSPSELPCPTSTTAELSQTLSSSSTSASLLHSVSTHSTVTTTCSPIESISKAVDNYIKWDAQPIAPPEFREESMPTQTEKKLETGSSLIGVIQSSLDSDHDSDVDLFKRIKAKDVSIDSEPEESILSGEDDDDFKVHFVHHGKKETEDEMNHRPDLMQQINELQEAVVSMKGSLREAVANLSLVAEDASSGRELEESRRKCEGNSAEILKLVLGVKTDLSTLRNEVSSICSRQDSLQKSINLLLDDRRILASDLSQAGVISQRTRSRLDSFDGADDLIDGGGRSGSGSHSNDSGVALLTDKSQNIYANDSEMLHSSAGRRTSDQDSIPDQPSLLVPASVYDYVAGLHQPNVSLSSNNSNQFSFQETIPSKNESSFHENEGRILDSDDAGIVYDSDSSLTIAANKTISLSTCISEEMRINEPHTLSQGNQTQSSSDDTKSDPHLRQRENSKQTKEQIYAQNRRRRPLLGISSTKQHISSSAQIHSSEKERHRHKHRHLSKADPREMQRYKLAKELLDTEKKYCRTLWTIQETFAEPLKKAAILSNKDISTLFPEEVFQLYDKHCLLQHQLKERLASWKWQPLIGDILARFTDPRHCEILRIYTNYVNDFPEVLKTFHKLCHTSQPFTDFIKSCLEQPSCAGQDLGAFLLTPVQRVPRYILILKQLLKHTDSSHPDYKLINTTLERLRDFLSRLNDAMEHSFKLVHSSLSTSVLSSTEIQTSASSKYRCGRSPCRANLPRESPPSSPSDRRNRRARVYQESSSMDVYRSPQRSCSNAGPSQKLTLHQSACRSSSLPRGFLSSSDSHDSSGEGGQESSPERARSRILQKAHSAHEPTVYHSASTFHPLTTARSVTNVTALNEEIRVPSRWEDLTASEPSLIDPIKQKSSTIGSAHSAHNVATTHKLVTWTDSVESEDTKAKKKSTIKSSIKNIFTFKKRGRNGREEPLYWPSSVVSEGSESQGMISQNQHSEPETPAIGDFVDEEGNPCTNV